MDNTASYARKFNRALKHLDDLGSLLLAYEKSQPYTTIRDRNVDPDPRAWMHRAELAEQPSPDIPLVLGDFIHNLRSSLDHIVVAVAPNSRKRKARWPIANEDIWAKDPNTGEYISRDADARQAFASAIKGLPDDVCAFIKDMQPYNLGAKAKEAALSVISALDNADKHAQLVTITTGIKDVVTQFVMRDYGLAFSVELEPTNIYGAGDVVSAVSVRPEHLNALPVDHMLRKPEIIAALSDPATQVDVQIFGTPQVVVEVPGVPNKILSLGRMRPIAEDVRDNVLTRLEGAIPS